MSKHAQKYEVCPPQVKRRTKEEEEEEEEEKKKFRPHSNDFVFICDEVSDVGGL